MHLKEPRIAPVEPETWTDAERDLLAPIVQERGTVPNIYRTMARHPSIFKARLGFGQYLQRHSSLPPREREIVICRAAWLSAGEYEWSAHVQLGLRAGLTEEEIPRIAYGPTAPGWSEFDRAILQAVDELYMDQFITDSTWATLTSRYSVQQVLDLIMTAGGYHMLAMALNSWGVQNEAGRPGFPLRSGAVRPHGSGGVPKRLKTPRVPPVSQESWTDEERELLEGYVQERGLIPNVFGTMARHPALYRVWSRFAGHVLRRNSLPVRDREMLICRAAWLASGEYEWSAHIRIGMQNGMTEDDVRRLSIGADAEGWSDEDRWLVRAADELHYDVFISDPTWAALSQRYDTVQMMNIVFTVGQYKMLAMALNSLGAQLQEDMPGFAPWLPAGAAAGVA